MLSTLRTEMVVLSEVLFISASCLLSPIHGNSVLEGLRVKRLVIIQEEICCRAL